MLYYLSKKSTNIIIILTETSPFLSCLGIFSALKYFFLYVTEILN